MESLLMKLPQRSTEEKLLYIATHGGCGFVGLIKNDKVL